MKQKERDRAKDGESPLNKILSHKTMASRFLEA